MCDTCINDARGCTCQLAEEKELAMMNFQPTPAEAKKITFKKSRKRVVKAGADLVQKQDQAMWSTLMGSATKKCLLAVTLCAHMFSAAIGHNTNFFDPGIDATKCDDEAIYEVERGSRERRPLGDLHTCAFPQRRGKLDGFQEPQRICRSTRARWQNLYHGRYATH